MPEKHTNRLINEKSPYLLQHAHNPVDWYPWCNEAFLKAQIEDKPIFLSIGYSTCHWCHVMERESFENNQTAEILNKYYVSIKVDREERSDVDAVYMDVCMAMNRNGGWPLTVLMTPEQKPFYTATYLPKESRYGLIGLDDLLLKIAQTWQQDREKLVNSADSVSEFIKEKAADKKDGSEPSKEIINYAAELLMRSFDTENGGFGGAPKFPAPHNLIFLLLKYSISKDKKLLMAVEKTLDQMYRGGIFDHIGGGFSRYSTDSKWLVPHFEKMLYDNALLLYAYPQAYTTTKKEHYKYVCSKIADYVLRELTHENGGLFCGQDADSDGVEGKYYVFSPSEIEKVLGQSAFCNDYDITENGNFEGKSIPNLLKNNNYEDAHKNKKRDFELLHKYRFTRTRLHKDDKILVSWNALMIAALAKAYFVFGNREYLYAAEKAFLFIKNNMISENYSLSVRWKDGELAGQGKIDDYAFFALAALELYNSTFNAEYLKTAYKTAFVMIEKFFDDENGGFYIYAHDSEQLLTRPKEIYDGAIPSGNSAAAFVLERLWQLTADMNLKNISYKQLSFLAGNIEAYPAGYSFSLTAMLQHLFPSVDLVCVSSEKNIEEKIIEFLREKEITQINILLKTKENADILTEIAPFTRQYSIPAEGTLYYLCKNGVCKAPVNDINKLNILNS